MPIRLLQNPGGSVLLQPGEYIGGGGERSLDSREGGKREGVSNDFSNTADSEHEDVTGRKKVIAGGQEESRAAG